LCSLLLALSACFVGGGHPDRRAYPGSDDVRTLDQYAKEYDVILPACTPSGLRFFATDDLVGAFYLTFTASKLCVSQFLAGMHIPSTADAQTEVSPFSGYEESKFGWKIPAECSCAFYTQPLGKITDVKVAVVPAGGNDAVYLRVDGGS
jgi:hypothetical protein